MRFPSSLRTSLAGALVLLLPFSALAAAGDANDLQALREQVRVLEQQLKALARQIDAREAAPTQAAPAAASVSVTDKGYAATSVDAANSIRLRALLQFDSRVFFEDGGIVNNTFTLRRARLIAEGKLARNYGFQFVTEFGGSTVSVLDANLTVALAPALQLKAGKFKTPVGLEVLVSDQSTPFIERSMVATLLPNRDLGVQLGGDLLGGRLNYAVGVFNGVADGANSNNLDFDEDKDVVGRAVARPFKNVTRSLLSGLSLGLGASHGRQKGAGGRTAGYRTDGQQIYFGYSPGVIADGRTRRLSPQLDYRLGALGMMAEYVVSSVTLRSNMPGPTVELEHQGWQLTGSYVLTGEDSSQGGVVPRENFDLEAGTWGAFEVLARFAGVRIDEAGFPLFASPGAQANQARSWTIGLSWHLSKAVRFMFNYSQTDFGVSALAAIPVAPLLRQDEKVFLSRFQLAF